MLQAIRDRVSGIIAVIILGLLALTVTLVGVQGYLSPDPANVVAVVGDEDITASQFQQSFNQQRSRVQQFMGDSFNPAMFEGTVPRREHLEQMINELLLQQYAEANGLEASPQRLAETIAAVPSFQVGGQFDGELYRRILNQSGFTPAQFEESQRLSLRMQALLGAVNGSAFATTEETNQVLKLREERRHVQFFPVLAQRYRDSVEITDDDIRAYYDEHNDAFMTQEQVVIDYLEVNAADYVDEITISEETLRDRYEQQKGRFVAPERRLTSHILLTYEDDEEGAEQAALAQAQELARRAREGEEFAALAEEFSQDPGSANSGGDLGWVETGVMVAPFEEALFAMEEGGISGPVQTAFGYHVIWLREVEESHGQSFEDVKQELRREVAEEQSRQTYDDIVRRLTNITYEDSGSLQRAAEEVDIPVKTSPPFGRGGGPGIASYPEVARAAFDELVLRDGLNSDPLQVEPDHIVVLRLNEHRPSTLRPLDEVSEEIRSILVQERSSEMAKEAAEAAVVQLRDGALDITAAAAAHEAEVTTMEQMGRRDFQAGLPFIEAVFALPEPDQPPSYHVAQRNNQDWAVVALHSIQPGDPEAAQEATRQQVQRDTANYYARAEREHLVALLRQQTEIQVYEDRL